MIPGPASLIASPVITKMPVPTTAPSPRAVRSSVPMARRSCWPSLVSSMSRSVGLVASGPGGEATAATSGVRRRGDDVALAQLRVAPAIGEVDDQPDDQPDAE